MAVDSDDDSALLTAGAEQGAADEAEAQEDDGNQAELRLAARGRQRLTTDADLDHTRTGGRRQGSDVAVEDVVRADGTVHGQQVTD